MQTGKSNKERREMIQMASIRQRICNYLCEKPPKRNPFTILKRRNSTHISNTLYDQFHGAHIRIRDKTLNAPTRKEFEAWLKNDPGNLKKYHAEWYDCDDFAIALRHEMVKIGQAYKTTLTVMYCEGYMPSGYHAYNMLIDNTDAIYIIEPQNDHVVPVDDSKYLTDFIQL